MNSKIRWVIVVNILLFQSQLFAQGICKSVQISALHEMVAIPYGQVFLKPIHPGIALGTELWVKAETKWYQSLGVDASYYYHQLYEHALMLDAVYNIGYTLPFKLRLKTMGALGYKHSILTGDTYVLENGSYKKKQHPGQAQINAKIGFGLSYPISQKISLSGDYMGMLAFPYSPDLGMPFATHALIRLGVKMNLQ